MTTIPRIVSIFACSRGIGYAVFEENHRLVDWGRREFSHKWNVDRMLAFTGRLLQDYQPDALVLRQPRKNQRPTHRATTFHRGALALAKRQQVPVREISQDAIYRHFTFNDLTPNKSRMCRAIAARYSELALLLPKPKLPGADQSASLCLFEAVAMAMTYTDRLKAAKK